MNVEVRTAAHDDLEAIAALFDEMDEYHADHLPDIFEHLKVPFRPMDELDKMIHNGSQKTWVAACDGQVIGFIHAVIRRAPGLPLFKPRQYVYIEHIAVRKDYRENGIGSGLMAAIEMWACQNRINEVEMHVWQGNEAAMNLCRRMGFEVLTLRLRKKFQT